MGRTKLRREEEKKKNGELLRRKKRSQIEEKRKKRKGGKREGRVPDERKEGAKNLREKFESREKKRMRK